LECLRYAHENGCPWNEHTCRYAAKYGYLECLRYAHEHGCHWGKHTFYVVTNVDCIRYAHENGRLLTLYGMLD
jgi:hypothetical protein